MQDQRDTQPLQQPTLTISIRNRINLRDEGGLGSSSLDSTSIQCAESSLFVGDPYFSHRRSHQSPSGTGRSDYQLTPTERKLGAGDPHNEATDS
jgi:hypothetical protein